MVESINIFDDIEATNNNEWIDNDIDIISHMQYIPLCISNNISRDEWLSILNPPDEYEYTALNTRVYEDMDDDNGKDRGSNSTYCRCMKSRCIKLYCICYNTGVSCGKSCVCIECRNTDINKDSIDIYRHKTSMMKGVKNRTVRYCRCVNVSCSNNHCPCHRNNSKCSAECLCYDCKNNK